MKTLANIIFLTLFALAVCIFVFVGCNDLSAPIPLPKKATSRPIYTHTDTVKLTGNNFSVNTYTIFSTDSK